MWQARDEEMHTPHVGKLSRTVTYMQRAGLLLGYATLSYQHPLCSTSQKRTQATLWSTCSKDAPTSFTWGQPCSRRRHAPLKQARLPPRYTLHARGQQSALHNPGTRSGGACLHCRLPCLPSLAGCGRRRREAAPAARQVPASTTSSAPPAGEPTWSGETPAQLTCNTGALQCAQPPCCPDLRSGATASISAHCAGGKLSRRCSEPRAPADSSAIEAWRPMDLSRPSWLQAYFWFLRARGSCKAELEAGCPMGGFTRLLHRWE